MREFRKILTLEAYKNICRITYTQFFFIPTITIHTKSCIKYLNPR